MNQLYLDTARLLTYVAEGAPVDLRDAHDDTQCKNARAISQHKLTDVRTRIADLKRIETVLNGLVQECASTTAKTTRCPIIFALNNEG